MSRCLYPLIGLLPWRGDHFQEGFESVVGAARREWVWRPVEQADVGIRFSGEEWWRVPVEPDGHRSFRLDRLPVGKNLPSGTAVEFALWVRGKLVKTWSEPVDPAMWQRLHHEPAIPLSHWPARLVVGLLPWEGLLEREQPRWERRLVQELSRVTTARGGKLLWLNSDSHTFIDRERRRQYLGPVAEDKQVRIGHEEGATILIRPITQTSGSLLIVGADVLAVETGETLLSITWEVSPLAMDGAAESLIARLGHLLEQAPLPTYHHVHAKESLR